MVRILILLNSILYVAFFPITTSAFLFKKPAPNNSSVSNVKCLSTFQSQLSSLKILNIYKYEEYRIEHNVSRLSTKQLEETKVFIENRKLVNSSGQTYRGKYLFVLSKYGLFLYPEVYLGLFDPTPDSYFHHSSFNQKEVSMAGIIEFNYAGDILAFNRNSGHYRPSKEYLYQFHQYLIHQNIDLSKARINYNLMNRGAH